MSLVRFSVAPVFHLTVMFQAAVLNEMSMFHKTGFSTIHWREFGTPSWRKVATLTGGLLALGLGYHVMFGQNGLTSYEQKRSESRMLEHQMQSLQHENELLKGHVDALQSDPDALEIQARKTMHYARSGEVIYEFQDAPRGPQKAVPVQQ